MAKPPDESYSKEETARRRDEALKRALSTPYKPQSKTKVGAKPKTPKPVKGGGKR